MRNLISTVIAVFTFFACLLSTATIQAESFWVFGPPQTYQAGNFNEGYLFNSCWTDEANNFHNFKYKSKIKAQINPAPSGGDDYSIICRYMTHPGGAIGDSGTITNNWSGFSKLFNFENLIVPNIATNEIFVLAHGQNNDFPTFLENRTLGYFTYPTAQTNSVVVDILAVQEQINTASGQPEHIIWYTVYYKAFYQNHNSYGSLNIELSKSNDAEFTLLTTFIKAGSYYSGRSEGRDFRYAVIPSEDFGISYKLRAFIKDGGGNLVNGCDHSDEELAP